MIVTGVRLWVHVLKCHGDALAALRTHFEFHAMPDAAMSLDAILDHSRLSATRPIDVRCPKCPGLSPDEARLLHATVVTIDRQIVAYGRQGHVEVLTY